MPSSTQVPGQDGRCGATRPDGALCQPQHVGRARLTEETLVIDGGRLVLRDRTPRAVDYYLSSGLAQSGERGWGDEARVVAAAPFRPLQLRISARTAVRGASERHRAV